MQRFCTFDVPGRAQNGWLTGILRAFRTSRLIFELNPGAATQTSTVCPARNFRCFFESDEIAGAALRRTLPSFSALDLNGHFEPLQVISSTYQPSAPQAI